jgi:hypothetical protein
MNKLGWLIQEALAARVQDVEASAVNCGTCPVSVHCMAKATVTQAWEYACCKSLVLEHETLDGMGIFLILDCARRDFVVQATRKHHKCTLCSSGALNSELRGWTAQHRWLPTVYADPLPRIRLAAWRTALPSIRERIKRDAEIKARGSVKP